MLVNLQNTIPTRQQWIYNFVKSRLPDYLSPYQDDICQEIMIKLIRADDRQGEKVMNFGYIKQTSMSVLIDYMRKFKNRIYEDTEDTHLNQVMQDQQFNPENLVHKQILLEQINTILLTFSAQQKNTLLMYLRGMKLNEIAELTGLNKSSVRNEIYRGKQKLMKALKNKGVDYEI